jgi:hypothetical protein
MSDLRRGIIAVLIGVIMRQFSTLVRARQLHLVDAQKPS